MRAFLLIASLAISTTVGALGCGSAPPAPSTGATEHADHHDVPITEADVQMPANYAEAVVRIKGYRDAIRTAAQGTEPELAHRPLDELDIVLNRLPEIARDHGVPKERWETVNTAGRELRNLFNQVHAAIDEHRKPDYTAVAQPIDEQIAKLEQAAGTP